MLMNSTRNKQPASVVVFHPGAGVGSIPLWPGTIRFQRCEAGEDCSRAGGCVEGQFAGKNAYRFTFTLFDF